MTARSKVFPNEIMEDGKCGRDTASQMRHTDDDVTAGDLSCRLRSTSISNSFDNVDLTEDAAVVDRECLLGVEQETTTQQPNEAPRSPSGKKKKKKNKRKQKKNGGDTSKKSSTNPANGARRRQNSNMSFESDSEDLDLILARDKEDRIKQQEKENAAKTSTCPSPTSTAKFSYNSSNKRKGSCSSKTKTLPPILRLSPPFLERCSSVEQKRAAVMAAVAYHKRRESNNVGSPVVSFGTATVHEMKRHLSLEVVPSDGGYPLGLSDDCVNEFEYSLVDGERIIDNNMSSGSMDSTEPAISVPERCAVTIGVDRAPRQSEAQRKVLLLPCMDPHYNVGELKQEKQELQKQAKESHGHRTSARLEAKNKSLHYHNTELEHDCTLIRNELEAIRSSRSEIGCSCHRESKFLDHFDPENANLNLNKIMSDRKLRDEMKKRHLLTPKEVSCSKKLANDDKRDMMTRLKAAMEVEPCCRPGECECATSGVACHADVCGCCSDHKSLDASQASSLCGNAEGVNIVDITGIRANREKFVQEKAIDHEC